MSTPTSQKIEPTTAGLVRPARAGILPGVAHLATDVADRGQASAIGFLQDARIELRGAVDGGVDLAEKVTASFFRFTRKGIQRVDDASAETLAGVGQVLAGAVKNARETTRSAAELATAASSSVTGQAPA